MSVVFNWIDQAKQIDVVSIYISIVMLIYLVFDKLGGIINEKKTAESIKQSKAS